MANARKIDIANLIGVSINEHGTANSVPANNETVVASYLVDPGKTFYLIASSATAIVDTVFRIYLDNELKEEIRTSWTNRTMRFIVEGRCVQVKITAEHMNETARPFKATIVGKLY